MPDEFITDAIGEASTILELNHCNGRIPPRVYDSPVMRYKYLYTIASRRLEVVLKRQSRMVRITETNRELYFEAHSFSMLEDSETLRVLLAELSPILRESIELHILQGYSQEEVGLMLQAKPETIKKRCARAMTQLKAIVQRERESLTPNFTFYIFDIAFLRSQFYILHF